MAEIVKIKKDGVIQYPITKPEAVIDENGKNVLQLIKENGGGSSYDDSELREAIEGIDNRVAAHSEEIVNLQENKADKSELTELSAEVSGLSESIVLRNVAAEDTDESVDEPEIPTPAPSASNEWKCVVDRRLLEGEKKIIFTTYADGTPLQAKEVMVQILIDKKAAQSITGYVGIKSTNNQNEARYGSLMYEDTTIAEGVQVLSQIHLEASPFFMVAKMDQGVKCTVAAPTVSQVQGGNLKTFQIYEDIVYVKIDANSALTSAAPYLKVYAR